MAVLNAQDDRDRRRFLRAENTVSRWSSCSPLPETQATCERLLFTPLPFATIEINLREARATCRTSRRLPLLCYHPDLRGLHISRLTMQTGSFKLAGSAMDGCRIPGSLAAAF